MHKTPKIFSKVAKGSVCLSFKATAFDGPKPLLLSLSNWVKNESASEASNNLANNRTQDEAKSKGRSLVRMSS